VQDGEGLQERTPQLGVSPRQATRVAVLWQLFRKEFNQKVKRHREKDLRSKPQLSTALAIARNLSGADQNSPTSLPESSYWKQAVKLRRCSFQRAVERRGPENRTHRADVGSPLTAAGVSVWGRAAGTRVVKTRCVPRRRTSGRASHAVLSPRNGRAWVSRAENPPQPLPVHRGGGSG
jgi:hypothetical protein